MSHQTSKAFHLGQHRHAIADAIWRSIGNTINVPNTKAIGNKAICASTLTLTAAKHVTTDYGVHAAKQYTMTCYTIYNERSTALRHRYAHFNRRLWSRSINGIVLMIPGSSDEWVVSGKRHTFLTPSRQAMQIESILSLNRSHNSASCGTRTVCYNCMYILISCWLSCKLYIENL